MGFSKYFLLVAVLGVLAKQSIAAGILGSAVPAIGKAVPAIGNAVPAISKVVPAITSAVPAIANSVSQKFLDAKKEFALKEELLGDDNLVNKLAKNAVAELEEFEKFHSRPGPMGDAIKALKDGFEHTIALVGVALHEAFALVDGILQQAVTDKRAAINKLEEGIDRVKYLIYHAGCPVHLALGASRVGLNITDNKNMKAAANQIQLTGTGLFKIIEAMDNLVQEGLKSDVESVTQKCLAAAHKAIKAAAVMSNTNMVRGAEMVMNHLSSSQMSDIATPDAIDSVIHDKVRQIAAADKDTQKALDALNREFDTAIDLGISAPILNEIRDGLDEYIDYSALSVALCNEGLTAAEELAKTDKGAAIELIDEMFEIAKQFLIDGSIKGYIVIGSGGKKAGLLDAFEDAIHFVEMSRVEGTKGMDSAATVAKEGIIAGDAAMDFAFDAARAMIDANESVLFGQAHECIDVVFDAMKPGAVHTHAAHP